MTRIELTQERDPVKRLKELTENLKRLEDAEATIDATGIKYVSPLTTLPIAALITQIAEERSITVNCPESLRIIDFPFGSENLPDHTRDESIPIIRKRLSVGKESPHTIIENISQQFGSFVIQYLDGNQEAAKNYQSSVMYFLSEMCDNVDQHAEAKNLWLSCQFWKSRGELEFCLVDDGDGLKRCYDKRGIGIADHVDALRQAIRGVSSKELHPRGYGIGTNIKLFCSGELRGEFVMISGNACYLRQTESAPRLGEIPVNWQGVIVSGRLCRPKSQIQMAKYISD